ncbi:hypothetical protein D3C76_1854610 [compost metagenome]
MSFSLLIARAAWQIWAVILPLLPADMIKSKVDHENAKAAGRKSFFSQTQNVSDSKKQDVD